MKSQTPTWAIITGILMMLVGGCGIKNDIQSIKIREILSLKDTFINKITEAETNKSNTKNDTISVKNEEVNQDDVAEIFDSLDITDSSEMNIEDAVAGVDSIPENDDSNSEEKRIKETIESMIDVPEPLIQRIITFGYSGLFFSLLFIIGGLFLFIKKSFSISLAYSVLGANVVFSIVKWFYLSGGSGLVSMTNSVSAGFSILLSIIIFVIIISSDKSHFEDIYVD
ncbi:MAG: hypothetical protein WBO36_09570 [Saprospiraceae bacterium]